MCRMRNTFKAVVRAVVASNVMIQNPAFFKENSSPVNPTGLFLFFDFSLKSLPEVPKPSPDGNTKFVHNSDKPLAPSPP